jgi:putative PIN family toxin of toxin-antitoxin system
MRVVLDTNVLVSACWKRDGLEAQVARMAISGEITPCVSAELLAEYRDVLARKKLAALAESAKRLLDGLERAALHVEPTTRLTAATDDDDNRFLECAEAADAEYLITGNLRHYPSMWGQTKIVNARGFLERSGSVPQR